MINLEDPKKFRALVGQANQVAMNMLRPISRKYDLAEHEYPKELDMLAAMIDGLSESGASEGAGAAGVRRDEEDGDKTVKNGANLASVMSIAEIVLGRCRPAALHAASGPRQLRDRLGRGRRAAQAVRGRVGRDGDHRAGVRLGLRRSARQR